MRRAFLPILALAILASPPAAAAPAEVSGESSIEIKQVEAFSKLDFILPDGQLSSRIEARRSLTGLGLATFYDFPKGVIRYKARLFTGFG